jgi:hypothetical protein
MVNCNRASVNVKMVGILEGQGCDGVSMASSGLMVLG